MTLIQLGKLHSDRYQRRLQSGDTTGYADQDDAITALSEAHGLLAAGDSLRPTIAGALGMHLTARYSIRRTADSDRDTAIDLYDEVLRSPDVSPSDSEMGHFSAGQLLLLRALPGADLTSGNMDMFAVSRMLSSTTERNRADLDLAIAHFETLADLERPTHPQIQAAVSKMLPLVKTLGVMLGLGNPSEGGGLGSMFDAVNDIVQMTPAGTPGAEQMNRMRDALLGTRAGLDKKLGGPLDSLIGGFIQEHSGIQLLLAPLLREFARVTGVAAIDALADRAITEALSTETVRLLADATARATAYPTGQECRELVTLARDMLDRTEHMTTSAADRGLHQLVLAMTLILRGAPDDVAAADAAIRAACADVPADHPAASIAVELCVLLMDDRYPFDGILAGNSPMPTSMSESAATPVARAYQAVTQVATMLGTDARTAALTAGVAALDRAVTALPDTYPWTCRVRGALGVAMLSTGAPAAIRRGTDLLLDSARRTPEHHAAHPALRAVAGHAALFAAERLGDAPDDAIAWLDDPAPLGSAHLMRHRAIGRRDDLDASIRLLEQAAQTIDPTHSPIVEVCRVGADLAEARRLRGDLGAAVEGALSMLRTGMIAASVGVDVRLGATADRVVAWCIADNWLAGAVEAAEIGQALSTEAPGGPNAGLGADLSSRNLPYGLDRDARSLDACRRARAGLGLPSTVAVPTVVDIGAALTAVGADALVYLVDGGQPLVVTSDGRVHPIAAELRVPAEGPVAHYLRPDAHSPVGGDVCDWAWTAAMGSLASYRRLVLVPRGNLGSVPWHAARHDGRYVCADVAVSYAGSATELVALAPRRSAPVYKRPVLVRAQADAVDAIAGLRETFYPNAITAGVEGVRALLAPPTTMIQIGCTLPVGPFRDASGLVILTEAAPAGGVSALLAAGAATVIDTTQRVPAAMVFMLHHYLVFDELPPAEALRQAQLWMLDPARTPPDHMPPARIARESAAPDAIPFADVASWIGLRHHGR